MTESRRICDYEGSTYRTDFWEGKGRSYEDVIERDVLRQLLPTTGKRLVEIGAGFGRLGDEYHAYEQVVLFDYSFSQLQYARQQFGDERFIYVAGDAYQLPFQAGTFDVVTMIRVLHHFEDVPKVLAAIQAAMTQGGTFVLEFANKRNLKAMLRHALGKQTWNPNDLAPIEFVNLNFDFHPRYIAEHLQATGFRTDKRVPVSFFRLGWLKNNIPTNVLSTLDAIVRRTGWLVAPSIFTRNQQTKSAPNNAGAPIDTLFVCPKTRTPLQRQGDELVSPDGTRWGIRDGIYYFKEPL